MAPRVKVVRASPADAALVHALTQRAWLGTVAADSSACLESPATVEGVFAAGGGALLLRVDGEAVGSVRWLPVPHAVPSWEVKRLGVLPGLRGRYLGERLMAALHLAAQAARIERVQLGVRVDQPRLIDFYRALGDQPDPAVALSSHNPRSAPPVTMSRRLDAAAQERP
jgi:ribosomal protein S18 acetylase RimI-like enzyme